MINEDGDAPARRGTDRVMVCGVAGCGHRPGSHRWVEAVCVECKSHHEFEPAFVDGPLPAERDATRAAQARSFSLLPWRHRRRRVVGMVLGHRTTATRLESLLESPPLPEGYVPPSAALVPADSDERSDSERDDYEWEEVQVFGRLEPLYVRGRCLHRRVVEVRSVVDDELLAYLCTTCNAGLSTMWASR